MAVKHKILLHGFWVGFVSLWCAAGVAISQPAFPGAQGFGAQASGGRGGKVIYVTNLQTSGPGSLAEALSQQGPRYILFKVSGVIPGTISVPAGRGNFTIAGQTSPGGIIVRGFEMYNDTNPSVSNIIIRHLRSRIGDRSLFPTPHWMAEDGITIGGVHNAIFDHCSFAHASDEAVDISRSSRITMQHCILAETLGGHADLGGMLINYSNAGSRLDSLTIHHNIWNRIGGRMPEISCESPYCKGKTIKLELSGNLFWDPQIELWYEGVTGFGSNFYVQMNAVQNMSMARTTYGNGMFHRDLLDFSQNRLFFEGNKMNLYPQYKDYDLFYCCNDFPDSHPNTNFGVAVRSPNRFPYPVVNIMPISLMVDRAGAFPRDAMDTRLTGYVVNNNILGVPVSQAGANDAFVLPPPNTFPQDTDNDGMPDYWENVHGTDMFVQDHNGFQLSQSIAGVQGYTNLECYLNCLSDALVNGSTSTVCAIQGFPVATSYVNQEETAPVLYPNPAEDVISFQTRDGSKTLNVVVYNTHGIQVASFLNVSDNTRLDISSLPGGMYFVRMYSDFSSFIYTTRIVKI